MAKLFDAPSESILESCSEESIDVASLTVSSVVADIEQLRQNLRLTMERHRLEQEHHLQSIISKLGISSRVQEKNEDLHDDSSDSTIEQENTTAKPKTKKKDKFPGERGSLNLVIDSSSRAVGLCNPSPKMADCLSMGSGDRGNSKIFKNQNLKHDFTSSDMTTGNNSMALRNLNHPIARSRFAQNVALWMDWWSSLQEPDRKGLLANFISTAFFEMLCLTVIVSNGASTIHTTNYSMREQSTKPTRYMEILEIIFLACYGIELSLKLRVHRLYFFVNADARWNVFDTTLVVLAVLEHATTSVDIAFMRTLRLLKVSKVFRMFRVLRFFSELRLMLDCVLGSFMSLFWACSLLLFFNVIFSIIFVQGIADHLTTAHDVSQDDQTRMSQLFGSVQQGVLTLFWCSFGADPLVVFRIVRETSYVNSMAFVGYVMFFNIAFINILTSIFIEKAMTLALPDTEEEMLEKRKLDLKHARVLRKLIEELDEDASGYISRTEFKTILDRPRILAYMEHHGLDVKDADMFYKVLSHSKDKRDIEIHELVDGCLKMRGYAQSVDLMQLLFEVRQNQKSHSKFQYACANKLDELAHRIEQMYVHSPQILQAPPLQSAVRTVPL